MTWPTGSSVWKVARAETERIDERGREGVKPMQANGNGSHVYTSPKFYLPRHSFDRLRPANRFHLRAKFLVRPHLRRDIQQHREIPRRFQAETHLGLAGLALE